MRIDFKIDGTMPDWLVVLGVLAIVAWCCAGSIRDAIAIAERRSRLRGKDEQ